MVSGDSLPPLLSIPLHPLSSAGAALSRKTSWLPLWPLPGRKALSMNQFISWYFLCCMPAPPFSGDSHATPWFPAGAAGGAWEPDKWAIVKAAQNPSSYPLSTSERVFRPTGCRLSFSFLSLNYNIWVSVVFGVVSPLQFEATVSRSSCPRILCEAGLGGVAPEAFSQGLVYNLGFEFFGFPMSPFYFLPQPPPTPKQPHHSTPTPSPRETVL